MSAQEVAAGAEQLPDAAAAGDPIHDPGADEVRPRAAEAAGYVDWIPTVSVTVLPIPPFDRMR